MLVPIGYGNFILGADRLLNNRLVADRKLSVCFHRLLLRQDTRYSHPGTSLRIPFPECQLGSHIPRVRQLRSKTSQRLSS